MPGSIYSTNPASVELEQDMYERSLMHLPYTEIQRRTGS
jgi:hypothetical protein